MKKAAFQPADILLPNSFTDLGKWPVIACDQFTSEPEYWEAADEFIGDSPSSLRLILPELYLNDADVDKRIEKIHNAMAEYLKNDIFREYRSSMIYIRRIQSDGILREGIVGKIDLEEYDFSYGSNSQVRASEATVVGRIPPRMKIRQGAPLELPHVILLIDDPERTVIEPLSEYYNDFEKLYDTDLMYGGGNLSGYLVGENFQEKVTEALCRLSESNGDIGSSERKSNLIYAVGDGNHSLASAKEFYEQLKSADPGADLSDHPARYTLVELVNLHSPALKFQAINRLIYNTDCEKLLSEMKERLDLTESSSGEQIFKYVYNGEQHTMNIGNPGSNLTVGSVQKFLDEYTGANGGTVDYIHGKKTAAKLAQKYHGIALIFPDMDKSELFPTIEKDGCLPKKTFSMGHAEDKRYYMEARKIIP